jgi:hypothetical protein
MRWWAAEERHAAAYSERTGAGKANAAPSAWSDGRLTGG